MGRYPVFSIAKPKYGLPAMHSLNQFMRILMLVLMLLFTSTLQAAEPDQPKLTLSEAEQSWLKAHPKIRVSNENDYPPFDFAVGGQAQGLSVELLNILAQRIGIKIEYITGATFEQFMQQHKQGDIDVVSTISRTPEREKLGLFTEPYYQMKVAFVARKTDADIQSFDQLNGKTVAVMKGSQFEAFLKTYHPAIRRLAFNNMEQMLEAVWNGEADATLEAEDVIKYWQRKGVNGLKIAGEAKEFNDWKIQTYHFYLHNDAPQLQSLLNKALASLAPNELQSMQNKWINPSTTEKTAPAGIKPATFTTEQHEYLRRKGVIKMCVDPDWVPVEYITKDGKYEGMISDVMARFSETIGTKIVLVPTSTWQDSLDYAKNRQCDILTAARDTPKRRVFMNFTTPYLSFPNVIATSNRQVYITDIESVMHETFGVVKGYAYAETLKTRYPNLKLKEYDDTLQGLRAVQEGKLFGFLDTLPKIAYLIQTNAAYDIKVSGQIGRRHSISVATRNDEPILKDIFQVAVDAFPEIERQKVVDHWLAVRFEQGFDYVLMWKIIGAVASVLGLVIAGFYVWNRRLAKLNRELDLAHNKIAEQNSGLEQRVAERTLELSETVNQLELTQVELVQAEKLAALGSMVAGVSHELNTPLGTAILTATMIQDRHSELKTSSDEGHLKRTQLAEFLEDAGPTDELLIRSIERSINLVQNFKQTAIDQSLALRRTFNLAIECEESLHFLRQQYKKEPWQIKLDIPPDIELDSYPGALMQIIANLVINSINHGFDGRDKGCVTVKAIRDPKSETGKEYIFITVVDDGKGITPEHLDRVFDPFFTTKLGKGGSGIGLNVVYRIATRVLGGNITVSSIFGQGTTFTLHLPQQVPDSI